MSAVSTKLAISKTTQLLKGRTKMGNLEPMDTLWKHGCSVCSSCQAEFFYDGVSYFVASENGGPDAVVCRRCFDETLGR